MHTCATPNWYRSLGILNAAFAFGAVYSVTTPTLQPVAPFFALISGMLAAGLAFTHKEAEPSPPPE